MNKSLRPVLAIFLIFAAVSAVVAFSKLHTSPERVPWRLDFNAARAEAKTAGKPLFLYFTAEWCEPCQYMRRNVWTDSDVAAAMEPFVPVKIDADRNQELAMRYGAWALPKFVIVNSEGEVKREAEGGFDVPGFLGWLKGANP